MAFPGHGRGQGHPKAAPLSADRAPTAALPVHLDSCSPGHSGPLLPRPHVSAPRSPGLPTPPLPIALQSQVRVASSTSSPASLLPSKDLKRPGPDGSGSARWGAHPEGQAAHLCHVSHLPGSQPPAKAQTEQRQVSWGPAYTSTGQRGQGTLRHSPSTHRQWRGIGIRPRALPRGRERL